MKKGRLRGVTRTQVKHQERMWRGNPEWVYTTSTTKLMLGVRLHDIFAFLITGSGALAVAWPRGTSLCDLLTSMNMQRAVLRDLRDTHIVIHQEGRGRNWLYKLKRLSEVHTVLDVLQCDTLHTRCAALNIHLSCRQPTSVRWSRDPTSSWVMIISCTFYMLHNLYLWFWIISGYKSVSLLFLLLKILMRV